MYTILQCNSKWENNKLITEANPIDGKGKTQKFQRERVNDELVQVTILKPWSHLFFKTNSTNGRLKDNFFPIRSCPLDVRSYPLDVRPYPLHLRFKLKRMFYPSTSVLSGGKF